MTIRGERDDEKFKAEVRADVVKLGGFVKIVERTWRIKSRVVVNFAHGEST
ncbi:hypothetical protein WMF26_05245 [Sorangium sp. So ce185]|uniref:hypothetical protein n=1 Tax=Sorangium sp. So ce185 TaxID=3133287 RepID=UPI003F633ECF